VTRDPETHDPLTHGQGLISVYKQVREHIINTKLQTQIKIAMTD